MSNASLALVVQDSEGDETQYLAQWNHNWNAYSLIGGHVEDGETFRQACLREICEELECNEIGIEVAPYPYATLRFREYSRAAKEDTDYHWQVFVTRLPDTVLNSLPTDCQWVTADQIRSGSAADGKPIADQAKRVLKAVDEAEFDLFVSYGHADNEDGSVTALVEHIRREHERFAPTEPLKIFFDLWEIQNSDDWERRIYRGLIESKTMLAVLSPAYFASEWCQKEYETFHQQQLKKLYPGEPVHAIYIQHHPDFEASDTGDAHHLQDWFDGLKKQQFEDAKPWWPDGQEALQRDVVVGRLNELRQNIWKHVCDARAIQQSPSNLSGFNINFVGREQELTELWNTLRLDQAVAVSAIQGVGGLGKTALARAYAHTRRMDYLGGQFEIAMENVGTTDGLKVEIVRLANLYLGANIPDETTNINLNAAFATAKACFERPGQGNILLILDNVAKEGVLSARATCLPSPEFVHVLATTRLDPERWGLNSLKLESLSTKDALDLFQKYRPFQIPDDAARWNRILTNSESIPETEVDADEWKAAVGIVNRLGGHALAIEVVAVYLGNHRSISLVDYLQGLIRKGLSVKLSQAGDDPTVKARLSAAIETNIGALLEPTFERLEQENPLAMRALEWAALIPPDHVPWIWLQELIAQDHSDQLQHDPDDPDPWTDGVVSILRGWQLLTGDGDHSTSRMHRIVQIAVASRTDKEAAMQNAPASDRANTQRLLSYLTNRSDGMSHNWGRPGVNWELTPMFQYAQSMLTEHGAHVGLFVDRLTRPLEMDGRLLPAIHLQQQAVDLAEARAASAPEHPIYARNMSVSWHKMGDLLRTLGNGAQAREFYKKALEVSERLVANAPENSDYASVLSISYKKMGDVFRELGDGTKARELYEKGFEIDERLAASAPKNTDYASVLSTSCTSLGDLFIALGNNKRAREFHEKALEVSERLVTNSPDNSGYAKILSISYERMGDLLRELGDSPQAREFYRKALKVRERVASSAPENTDFARGLSISYERMGDLLENVGDGPQARKFYEKGLEITERLAAITPENSYYVRDLNVSYNKMGDLLSTLGNNTGAREFYEKAFEAIKRLAANAPENTDYARDLWVSCAKLGSVRQREACTDAARGWFLQAHDILQNLVDRQVLVSEEDLKSLKMLKVILRHS